MGAAERAHAAAGELLAAIEEALIEHDPPETLELEIPRHELPIHQIYWRARGLFRGARLMIEASLAENAVILGRPLFTESLWLQTFANAGDARGALVLGWTYESYRQIENLFGNDRGRDGTLTTESVQVRSHIARVRDDLAKYRAALGSPKKRGLGGEKSLAAEVGRLDDYKDFLLAHHMVHGTELAHVSRRSKWGERHFAISLETTDPNMYMGAAVFVGRSMLFARTAMADMFGWREVDPDGALREALTAAGAPLRTGSADIE